MYMYVVTYETYKSYAVQANVCNRCLRFISNTSVVAINGTDVHPGLVAPQPSSILPRDKLFPRLWSRDIRENTDQVSGVYPVETNKGGGTNLLKLLKKHGRSFQISIAMKKKTIFFFPALVFNSILIKILFGCISRVVSVWIFLAFNKLTSVFHASSCSVTRVNREPKSTSSHEPTSSQPRVKSIFFLFCPEKK